MRKFLLVLSAALVIPVLGCVERTLTVVSNPPGARVYLDGDEKGITPVTFRYDFYGKREFLLRKDGFRAMREVVDVNEPFYEKPGLDLISDLTPLPFSDRRTLQFTLEPVRDVNRDSLLDRANEMKYRLEGKPIPARARPSEAPAVPRPPSIDNVPVPPPLPAPETPPAAPMP